MTIGCRDADRIPKVADAGKVVLEGDTRIQIMHNGVRVVADGYYGPWMTRIIEQLRGHHEPQEEVVFFEIMKLLPSKATMVELGGFWSYYSLWFLAEGRERTSIIVEPDPNHLETGKRNAALNGRTPRFIQALVGAHETHGVPCATESAGTQLLDQISVLKLLERSGIDYLDVLHCDIQGAEVDVIHSCADLLRSRRIGYCVVSTHSHHISGDPLTHQKSLSLLEEFGGQILVEHDVHESFSGDGLIAAYFGPAKIDWPFPSVSRNRYATSLFRNPLFDLAERELQDGQSL